MTHTRWTRMERQPSPDTRETLYPPHRPGERVPIGEPWRYDDTPGAYQNAPLDSQSRVLYSDDEMWDEVDRLVGAGHPLRIIRTPEEMPAWAARRFRTVLSCVPVKQGDDWGWLETFEEEPTHV